MTSLGGATELQCLPAPASSFASFLCHSMLLSKTLLRFKLPCLGGWEWRDGVQTRRHLIKCVFWGVFSGVRVGYLLTWQLLCKNEPKDSKEAARHSVRVFRSKYHFPSSCLFSPFLLCKITVITSV